MVDGETPAIQPLRPHDPRRVGPYRLVGRLGAGGMGVVYAGAGADERRVAVKVVQPELAHDPDFRDRFAREVSLLHRVSDRCVARVMAADTAGSPPWFATEYIPGPTLDRRVDSGPMSGDELHGLATGLAEALVALHSQGIVHRDLKPSNLILAPDGPKVVDFGIARALDETSMTRTGVVLGSSGWISPEHYLGEAVGPTADVHAWGLIVYFAATGRRPYGRDRPEVMAARVLNTTPDTAALPDRYRAMVERALAKDPAARPSATELLTALATPLGGDDPTRAATAFLDRAWVMPPTPEDPAWTSVRRPSRRKAYLLGGGIAAAVTAAAAVTLVSLPSHGHPAAPTKLGGSRVANGGLSYILPTGWSSAESRRDAEIDVCVLPKEFATSGCGHGGLSIQAWPKGETPTYDSPTGWANSGDAGSIPGCMRDTGSGDMTKAITADGVTVRGTRPVGGRQAIYREYRFECRNGWRSTPRLWWLSQSGVLLETIELPDRYRTTVDAIARSIDLSAYQRPEQQTN
ncbi:serine/threonine-protein kinase [Actinoallomurus sp. CA-150999]|uniref:serine/threonine-protein kinase n=1 Tax=Actinoallomurus sp. CA-150999 TaxID=3239887 RepID=UPI003D90BF62